MAAAVRKINSFVLLHVFLVVQKPATRFSGALGALCILITWSFLYILGLGSL